MGICIVTEHTINMIDQLHDALPNRQMLFARLGANCFCTLVEDLDEEEKTYLVLRLKAKFIPTESSPSNLTLNERNLFRAHIIRETGLTE